jgi:pimeloyl-ACP methyl ester carboxylesterase
VSFGGVVAQRVALRHPDRVRTLTTFATGSSDASMLTVARRYLRWGTQVKLLRLTRRAGSDHGIALMRAAGYPDGAAVARATAARASATWPPNPGRSGPAGAGHPWPTCVALPWWYAARPTR